MRVGGEEGATETKSRKRADKCGNEGRVCRTVVSDFTNRRTLLLQLLTSFAVDPIQYVRHEATSSLFHFLCRLFLPSPMDLDIRSATSQTHRQE